MKPPRLSSLRLKSLEPDPSALSLKALSRDYSRDPNIKALKGMGFVKQGSTLSPKLYTPNRQPTRFFDAQYAARGPKAGAFLGSLG